MVPLRNDAKDRENAGMVDLTVLERTSNIKPETMLVDFSQGNSIEADWGVISAKRGSDDVQILRVAR